MYDGSAFPKSLDEQTFENWLEAGRNSKIGYNYLLVIWDDYDSRYFPIYVEDRSMINSYEKYESTTSRESLVAAYDLFSESRVS